MSVPSQQTPPLSARPVAVVTGASRGLGFLIARALADRGYDLVVNARSADGLAAAATELRSRVGAGGAVVEAPGDVGVEADAQAVVAAARQRFGRLDVLVANAGIIQVGPAAAMTRADYATAMDVMFWGVVHPVLAAMPALRERRGRVLVVTSVGGKLPAPHLLPYVAAKHAAVGFAEGMRIEAARHGVSVTVGVPGLMRTGSPRNALFVGDRAGEHAWFAVADSIPLLSMDAERAATRLVTAALRRKPEIILTPLAKMGARVHGLAPSTTLRLLTVAAALLPSDETPGTAQPGYAVRGGRALRALTTLTRRAARRTHEHTDPTAPHGAVVRS